MVLLVKYNIVYSVNKMSHLIIFEDTLIYQLTSKQLVAVEAVAAKCQDGDFMKDPASCDHFFKCDHGTPVKFSCGPGTWFNPDSNVCDWPYNVKCDVNPGGQSPGGGGGQPDKGSGQSVDKPGSGGTSSNGGYNGGQNGKPANNNQGQASRPDQGHEGSSQGPSDDEYLWPIQTPDEDSNTQNSNSGSSDQNGEERPRPTIDDLYNGNNNPYQEYVGNNRI